MKYSHFMFSEKIQIQPYTPLEKYMLELAIDIAVDDKVDLMIVPDNS